MQSDKMINITNLCLKVIYVWYKKCKIIIGIIDFRKKMNRENNKIKNRNI